MTKKDSLIFMEYLDELFPNAGPELNYSNNFELLVAVVLSAQTTDIQVNKVTEKLFMKYPTPERLKDADYDDVSNLIKSIGLYKTKSRNIIKLSEILVSKYNGLVPNKREDLESLPGVGRKTANVLLSNAFNIPAFAVDTHVMRVSKRFKIALEKDTPLQVEKKLMKLFPKDKWQKLHHQLILFGRYYCTARNPKCDQIKISYMCSYCNQKRN
ncbi:MAG: endonuclease III [Acholeplasmataceae bacterium]